MSCKYLFSGIGNGTSQFINKRNNIGSFIEPLESRWCPAADILTIGGTILSSFIDGDGDVITVRIEGSAGSVNFSDDAITGDGDGIVEDGESIATVSITGASSDFVLSFSVDSTNASNGNVFLGDITATSAILGINTVADTDGVGDPASDFELGSFSGTTLSKGGFINVDQITGNVSGLGLSLSSLAADRTINVRGALDADVQITGGLGGVLQVGTNVVGGNTWTIGNVLGTGEINVGGTFDADLTTNTFAGSTTIGGIVGGAWTVTSIAPTATLQADGWSNFTVNKNFGGHLVSTGNTINLTVLGNINATSAISSGGTLNLELGGNVKSGAILSSSGTMDIDMGGSFAGQATSQDDIFLETDGSVLNAKLSADDEIEITAAGNIVNSILSAQDDIFIEIDGSIVKSSLFAGDGDFEFIIGRDIVNSSLVGEGVDSNSIVNGSVKNSVFEGSESDIDFEVVGNLINTRIVCGSEDVIVDVGGNVVNSQLSSLESSVELTVGGNLVASILEAASDNFVDVGGSIINSVLTATDNAEILAVRNITNSKITCGDELIVDVTGNVTGTSIFSNTTTDVADIEIDGNLVRSNIVSVTTNDTNIDILGHMIQSTVHTDSEVFVNIGGNMTKSSINSTSSDADVNIAGSMISSRVEGADDAYVDVTLDILNSHIFGDEGSDSVIFTARNVKNSTVTSGSQDVIGTISGDIVNSKFLSIESAVELEVAGNIINSTFQAQSETDLLVGGSMIGSTAAGSSSDIDITGNLVRSLISDTSSLDLDVDGDVTSSTIEANSGEINIGQDLVGAIKVTSGSLLANIAGTVATGSRISVADDLNIIIGGALNGTLNAARLDASINSVSKGATIQVQNILDLDADNDMFTVTNDFNGRLDVSDTFDLGAVGPITIVGGQVGTGAILNIQTFDGTTAGVFNGNFNGTLNVGDDLNVDLTFNGNARQVNIGGNVNSTVTVGGLLTALTSSSFFDAANAFDGDFVDGSGNITGDLDTTGGYIKVTPVV